MGVKPQAQGHTGQPSTHRRSSTAGTAPVQMPSKIE